MENYKINYKSDFVIAIDGDAGWSTPFCIKFWTGMPAQGYFVGYNGEQYVNCRLDDDDSSKLVVLFDDHHLPIGELKMQIAYHTTIEEFPNSVFDSVTNACDVIVEIDDTEYQVELDFDGETAPELEFDLPAYANEAERVQNELQRQQNEAQRIQNELERQSAAAGAIAGAQNVNAQLDGYVLTVTNRNGVSTSVDTKGEKGDTGDTGPQGPIGLTGVSITSFVYLSETEEYMTYTVNFSDGSTQTVNIPKGEKGDTGDTGDTGATGNGIASTTLNADYTLTITYTDGTSWTTPNSIKGDTAVVDGTATYTLYDGTGTSTTGAMTQNATTLALDDVSNNIPHEVSSTWVRGTIKANNGTYNTSTNTLRSDFIKVSKGQKLLYQCNTDRVGIFLYNSNNTGSYDGLAVAYTDSDGVYNIPHDGYVILVVKNSAGTDLYPADRKAIFYLYPQNEYVLRSELVNKADINELASFVNFDTIAQGVGYPELASGKWRTNTLGGANRYHKVLERKEGMDFIKIDSDTSKTARYVFLTNYPNGLGSGTNDSVYTVDFCVGYSTVYEIPQNSSSGWLVIPADCKYIVFIEVNNAVNYLPKSAYVVKDLTEEINGYQLPFFCYWQGGLVAADGTDTNTTTARIKTGFFPVQQGDKIHIDYNNQHVSVREYDSSKTQIYNTGWYAKQEYVCQGNGYVRFLIANKAASTAALTPSDLTASITFPIDIDNRISHGDWRSKRGFVVGSWNIGHFCHGEGKNSTITSSDYAAMKSAYKDVVDYMDADLIGLSEYSAIFYNTETARDALFKGMSWGYVGTQRDYACQSVYANHYITGNSDINITSVYTQHYYTVLTFEHLGKTVKFVSIHFQANSQQADDAGIIAQFNELVTAFANDDYVIIAGDFNLLVMSSLSVFTNAGYTVANGGSWGDIETFSRSKSSGNYCLDNIAVKGFYMEDVKTFPFELSDHYPFVCRLMLKQN